MAHKDEVWRWDDSQAEETTGAEAQAQADKDLMEWTGATTAQDAANMLLGRPSLAERGREKSEVLHFKAPAYMAEYVKSQGNQSEYMRELIARDMQKHNRRLQTA